VNPATWRIWDAHKREYVPNRTFNCRVDAERFVTSLTKGKRNVRTAFLRVRLSFVRVLADGSCPDAVAAQRMYDSLMDSE
jgi:hypothetical protein